MGKQIINILPEGSAVLNPEHIPFCLSQKSKAGAQLPIYFNATVPAEIEFVRIDLETSKEETVRVPTRDVNKVAKAIREQSSDVSTAGFHWQYTVKKPGVYRLGRVLDEYKLEVQRATKDTYVVPCPHAKINTADSANKCIRDLSDLSLEVYGTPPLKIVYSRTINDKNHSFHMQSLQPDGFTSPLLGSMTSATGTHPENDISWVRPEKVTVSLSEAMTSAGKWEYSVDEVHDAFGNVARYAQQGEDPDATGIQELTYKFNVQERPKASMQGCDLRNALKVAKGKSVRLPVSFSSSGLPADAAYRIEWEFSPIDSLTNSGDHGDKVSLTKYEAKSSRDKPDVRAPGLYTLKSVSSGQCEGDVDEPSSCLILNPLEPHLSIKSEEIPDKCAGNSIGLRVDLDLVGTPPFTIKYMVITKDDREERSHKVTGLRSQLELIPRIAGAHKYVFKSIDDNVYKNLPLMGADKILEQVVRPAASAVLASSARIIHTCLDSSVEVDVLLLGTPPFSLEWEVVHDGKRKTEKVTDLQSGEYKIKTPTLTKGGDYILALSSVQDKRGCRTFLQDQMKISVRRQHPRASFGLIEQKHSVMAIKDTAVPLPLRLLGEGPWQVSYKNLNGSNEVLTKTIDSPNGFITAKSRGIYQIVDVKDNRCPGTVDSTASNFEVDWYPQPEMSLVKAESVKVESDRRYIKQEICEGDIDGFEIYLKGKVEVLFCFSRNPNLTNLFKKDLPHITSSMR